jgi:hypothetical protein
MMMAIMSRLLLCLAFVALAAEASAQSRVLGLLSLPEVFGRGACDHFKPEVVSLYRDPGDPAASGSIQVEQYWSFAAHGGCDGLEVRVRWDDTQTELPTLEYLYVAPAAIVLERRDRWFRIRLNGDTAWVQASVVDQFMPLGDLFEEFVGVTVINAPFTGRLANAPGSSASPTAPVVLPAQAARVIEIRPEGDQSWVQVEILSHTICDAGSKGPPQTVATGWLPLHGPSGEPTIWFSSRGC